MLLGYTDGITEARSPDKDFYTRDRLIQTINAQCDTGQNCSAQTLVNTIEKDLFNFIGEAPHSDDITMLAIKWQK